MGVISGIKMERCRRESIKGRKKKKARVLVEALCIFRFGELSPRFEEMGIQFGSSDRRRISSGDTKHPIVGEATGWYLNPPTVTPYLFFPSSSLFKLFASLPQRACIYLCATGNKPRERNEKTRNEKTRKLLLYLRTEKSFTVESSSRAVKRARLEEEAATKNVL